MSESFKEAINKQTKTAWDISKIVEKANEEYLLSEQPEYERWIIKEEKVHVTFVPFKEVLAEFDKHLEEDEKWFIYVVKNTKEKTEKQLQEVIADYDQTQENLSREIHALKAENKQKLLNILEELPEITKDVHGVLYINEVEWVNWMKKFEQELQK